MPDCFLTALKINIGNGFEIVNVVNILYNGIMKHYTLFKHKATINGYIDDVLNLYTL